MSINRYPWYARHIETEQFLHIDDGDAESGMCEPMPELYYKPTGFSTKEAVIEWIHALGCEVDEFEILNKIKEG